MKALILIGLCLMAGLVYGQRPVDEANPGSLWNNDASFNNPLHDTTASKEGDLITVIISESTAAAFTAQTTTSKADSAAINQGSGPVLKYIPGLSVGASSTTSGTGATSQTGTFTGTISAMVKRVFPNGTMLIEATRDIVYNKDTQTIRLSGLIRRVDITPSNTILSSQMANASIKASGKGQVSTGKERAC